MAILNSRDHGVVCSETNLTNFLLLAIPWQLHSVGPDSAHIWSACTRRGPDLCHTMLLSGLCLGFKIHDSWVYLWELFWWTKCARIINFFFSFLQQCKSQLKILFAFCWGHQGDSNFWAIWVTSKLVIPEALDYPPHFRGLLKLGSGEASEMAPPTKTLKASVAVGHFRKMNELYTVLTHMSKYL